MCKIDTVTPECLPKKKGLFCPCSPFSIEYARCCLKAEFKMASHILTPFVLVAQIFNQLNKPILIWKSAFKHHHCVLLLYWIDLYIGAMFDLWCSRPSDDKALAWSTQKRQDRDIPGHPAPWQALAAAAWRKWPGIRSSPHVLEGARLPRCLAMGCTAPGTGC